jgi:hypothetical protein
MTEPRRRQSRKPILYPWDDVAVGQSVTIPLAKRHSAQASANQWRKSRGVAARFLCEVRGDTVTITRVA